MKSAMVAVAMLGALVAAGCFNPKIDSGNLHCAPADNACPDGFVCSSGVCVTRADASVTDAPKTDLGPTTDGPTTDGPGSEVPLCTTPILALCTPPAGLGTCDPVCQTGCGCGLRCSVSTSGPVCVAQAPAGTKTTGQVCNPSSDDCGPGLACLRETCGTNLGRCYRFCRDASMCGAGVACSIQVNSSDGVSLGQLACDLAEQTCDPLLGSASGCPDPALGCFVTSTGHTVCDCPGAGGS